SATPLPIDRAHRNRRPARARARVTVDLSSDESARLRATAGRHGLTVNTVIQGVWALLLSRYSGRSDVVFGATVAGRPDIPGVESIVGMFVNTIPVRVTVDLHRRIVPWLHDVQLGQLLARPFQFTALARIHAASELPPGVDLFDSIVVFENYPVDDS